jgi:hypothetical protein
VPDAGVTLGLVARLGMASILGSIAAATGSRGVVIFGVIPAKQPDARTEPFEPDCFRAVAVTIDLDLPPSVSG